MAAIGGYLGAFICAVMNIDGMKIYMPVFCEHAHSLLLGMYIEESVGHGFLLEASNDTGIKHI